VTAKNYFWCGESRGERLWEKRLKERSCKPASPSLPAMLCRIVFKTRSPVELLLAGVPIERVSVLLGHQTVRITEKHYNPRVRSRHAQLEPGSAIRCSNRRRK